MTNWFELYEVARYGSFSKNETIIIIIVSSIFIAVSWLTHNHKKCTSYVNILRHDDYVCNWLIYRDRT